MDNLEELINGMNACEIAEFIIRVQRQTRIETIEEIKTLIDKVHIKRGLDDFDTLSTMCKTFIEENNLDRTRKRAIKEVFEAIAKLEPYNDGFIEAYHKDHIEKLAKKFGVEL